MKKLKTQTTFRRTVALPFLLALLLPITGCYAHDSHLNHPSGQFTGTVIGTLGGGLVGSLKGTGNLVAIGVETLAGTVTGSAIGSSHDAYSYSAYSASLLSVYDQSFLYDAAQRAAFARIGQVITWNNPQSGNTGTVTPLRDGRDRQGRYCREFQHTLTIGGKPVRGYGQACRQPDGSWEITQ